MQPLLKFIHIRARLFPNTLRKKKAKGRRHGKRDKEAKATQLISSLNKFV